MLYWDSLMSNGWWYENECALEVSFNKSKLSFSQWDFAALWNSQSDLQRVHRGINPAHPLGGSTEKTGLKVISIKAMEFKESIITLAHPYQLLRFHPTYPPSILVLVSPTVLLHTRTWILSQFNGAQSDGFESLWGFYFLDKYSI